MKRRMDFSQISEAALTWVTRTLFDTMVAAERESWRTLPAATVELFKDGSFHVDWYHTQEEVDRDARIDAIGNGIDFMVDNPRWGQPSVTTRIRICGHAVNNSFGHSCCKTCAGCPTEWAPGIAPPDGQWDGSGWVVPGTLVGE